MGGGGSDPPCPGEPGFAKWWGEPKWKLKYVKKKKRPKPLSHLQGILCIVVAFLMDKWERWVE